MSKGNVAQLHRDTPAPPDQSKIDDEERARRALVALGLSKNEVSCGAEKTEDLVFVSLIRLWKSLHRNPTASELWKDSGLKDGGFTQSTVSKALHRLRDDGRVLQPKYHMNVPAPEFLETE